MNHQTVWIKKWGGVCQGMLDSEIPAGHFQDALNVEVTRTGGLSPRAGMEHLTQTPDGKPVVEVAVLPWLDSDRTFVSTSHHVYRLSSISSAEPRWDLIHTFGSLARRVTFALFNSTTTPYVLFGNGREAMTYHDDTTTRVLTNAPIGFPVEYKNYCAVYGIPGHPGRVQFSINNGDPDTWLYGGKPRTLETEGKITAIVHYIGLIIFSGRKARIFHGDPDAPSGVDGLSEVLGCVGQKTIVEAEGRLYWLSYDGIAYWDGAGVFPAGLLSEAGKDHTGAIVRPSSISDDIRRLDWPRVEEFCAAFNQETRQIVFCLRRKAWEIRPPFRTYVFDLGNGGWWPWSLAGQAVSSITTERRTFLLVGSADGSIGSVGEGRSRFKLSDVTETASEADAAFAYHATSGTSDFGNPDITKLFRAFMLRLWRRDIPGVIPQRLDLEVNVTLSGDFTADIDEQIFNSPTVGHRFIVGTNEVGDRLSDTIDFKTEVRRPLAIKAKYLAWTISGEEEKNIIVIHAVGIGVRPHSRRDGLVWQNNLQW